MFKFVLLCYVSSYNIVEYCILVLWSLVYVCVSFKIKSLCKCIFHGKCLVPAFIMGKLLSWINDLAKAYFIPEYLNQ